MPKTTLTAARVERLRLRKTSYDVRDAKLRGFGVRVMPAGRKRFFIQCQHRGERVWKIVGGARRAGDERHNGAVTSPITAASVGPDRQTERARSTRLHQDARARLGTAASILTPRLCAGVYPMLDRLVIGVAEDGRAGGLPGSHRDPFDRMLAPSSRSIPYSTVSAWFVCGEGPRQS